jgi:Zn-dependent M28 family amino/carboxypeptidase
MPFSHRLCQAALAAGSLVLAAAPLDVSIDRAASAITGPALLSHIRVLASDEYGGRAPGTVGEQKSVAYLTAQCRALGLKPGNPDGTFIQKVALWGIRSEGTLSVTVKGNPIALASRQDYLASSQQPVPAVAIQDSALVFAGYGVVAPEFHWDDYKGIDVKGKTVVLLSGDPPVPDPNDPSKLDEKMFLGAALSYYGRPATKSETAYAKGAVAIITVFAPRNGANLARFAQNAPRETMILRDSLSPNRISAQASLAESKALEVFAAAGLDLSALRQKAVRPDFQPVVIPGTATFQLRNQLREVDSANVVAAVPGSDPKLRNEYVVYSGHWDHLGTEGDKIYHGASDNAAGAAGVLELARAFTKLKPAPKRTTLFLWTTAEEKGLLGALYYVKHPLYPLANTLADLNLDYFSNWGWGRTRDLSIVGLGNSTLDDLTIAAAKRQGRVITGDTDPAEGFYFRSDHLEFAKAGVPSLETSPGIDFVGKPAGYGIQVRDKYIGDNYHKVTDQVQPDWDLSGAVEDLKVLFEVGYKVAQGETRPTFKPDAPYQFAPRSAGK